MIQIRPDPESTRRLALAPRDPTRREDFFLGASRERHRRCLLRSAMDRPRKRARLPTPTRPSSSFAPRRMSRLTPRVPKRASPSPAPRAPAHAAPSGVDVVTRIKRVSQAYPEWCRTPKTCCRVTRGSADIESHVRNTRSPERTSRDCLLIRFSEISFKSSLDHRFPHPLARV
jgi:hypothetical protein